MLGRQPKVTELPLEFGRVSACRDFGYSIQLYVINKAKTEDIDTEFTCAARDWRAIFVAIELFDTGD